MTDAPALAAPDQAVVAAFERIDLVIADPMREIVAGRVDPDRAIADHVFAHRLLARAGTQVLVPAGPLDRRPATSPPACRPIRPPARAGRSPCSCSRSRSRGATASRPDAVVVGAFPDWLVRGVRRPGTRRRRDRAAPGAPPGHPLAFVEPPLRQDVASTWHAIVAALLPDAGDTLAVVRRPGLRRPPRPPRRAAPRGSPPACARRARRRTCAGTALDHANRVVAAATATLRGLEEGGWTTLVDEPLGMPSGRIGADAVAERSEAFDPIAAGGPGRG